MATVYSTTKAIHAAAVILHDHGGQVSRLRLLKLLYIANRESLRETLRSITQDRIIAMNHGPVPSAIHDLLNREHVDAPLWEEFIEPVGPQEHRLAQDPGVGELSRYEIQKLRTVSQQRRDKNDYDIALETQGFEEWKKNQPAPGSQRWIHFDDLLSALDLTKDKVRIEEAAVDDAAFDDALALVAEATRKSPMASIP
jgi:hypothetical protein